MELSSEPFEFVAPGARGDNNFIIMGHAISREHEDEEDETEAGLVPDVTHQGEPNHTPCTVDSAIQMNTCQGGSLIDHDVSHLTRVRSAPNEFLRRAVGARHNAYISTMKMLAARELNLSSISRFSSADCCHVLSRYLPNDRPWSVDSRNSKVYVSQFSSNGSLFVAGFQDRHIRVYNVDKGWKIQKDIIARNLSWTITDTSLSPDNQFLAYSSLSSVVHVVNVGSASTTSIGNITEIHMGLDFSESDSEGPFSIFSVKFSTDGRELIAGTGGDDFCIYLYDLERDKVTFRLIAHEEDVNSVTFADESGNVIYSGSDDSLCKVWDRRCLNQMGQAAGVLTGHFEGITFLDSRGDGRYFVSNGKDQCIKLWDIRKMSTNPIRRSRSNDWDYRWMEYPDRFRNRRHPNDLSLATYKGHGVLRTLVRCYFSPAISTGQKYLYSGSADGAVYIYDVITGGIVRRLVHHKTIIRDCSWHPFYPTLVSSSFDGEVALWEVSGANATSQ